ncbi:hypothetical protein ACWN83_01910 [Pseudolactococcus plantarum]|nr:hypothetical protein [Lactococcus plantarum]MDN6070675.1 hypothetical protein [Lactococcus plantarum]MDN6084136.1 hypothetical protein [Lactococcus plantarum]HCN75338.1 hypothetical protein [Lactococcus sp.]
MSNLTSSMLYFIFLSLYYYLPRAILVRTTNVIDSLINARQSIALGLSLIFVGVYLLQYVAKRFKKVNLSLLLMSYYGVYVIGAIVTFIVIGFK